MTPRLPLTNSAPLSTARFNIQQWLLENARNSEASTSGIQVDLQLDADQERKAREQARLAEEQRFVPSRCTGSGVVKLTCLSRRVLDRLTARRTPFRPGICTLPSQVSTPRSALPMPPRRRPRSRRPGSRPTARTRSESPTSVIRSVRESWRPFHRPHARLTSRGSCSPRGLLPSAPVNVGLSLCGDAR
jgi:hypothetical protein